MFEKFNINDMSVNVFDLIGKGWMLITSGSLKEHNTMTASWGGLGVLWHNPTATIYVRSQRFTKKFLDKEDFFTLSFFEEKYRSVLSFCGTNSGANVNKDEQTGISPTIFDESVAYEEAKLVLVCKKLYSAKMEPENITNPEIIKTFYPEKGYHYIYLGEITAAYRKK